MVTRRFAPWRLYTSAELYESIQLGEIGVAKTDYNEGFYTNHVSNTLDLISEEVTLQLPGQLLTVLTSTKVKLL